MAESALVTGANRGIGRAIASKLADVGYDLLLLARDRGALDEAAAACRERGVRVESLPGDLADEAYVDDAFRLATEAFGSLGVLVNNAGAAKRQAVQEADLGAWREVMELNFDAVVRLCRGVLPGMIERQSGTIINISSISGRNTAAESAIYCASKHALNGFSGCLYEDVREHGIKVSTIMPGFVDTNLTGELGLNAAHMIRPEDVAEAVQYVLGASASCCPTEIVLRPQQRP